MDRKEYLREYAKKPENKLRHKKSVYKSNAKTFVRRFATDEEMQELIFIFNTR